MSTHLPALVIIIPLICAPLCVLLHRKDWAFGVALLATWASFTCSILLTLQVMETGTISYAMGGWQPPYGIEIRLDALNVFVLLIVSGIGSVVTPYARNSLLLEYIEERAHMFFCAYLLCLCGLMGVAVTGDAFNLFVFLEISSLSSYVLIALGSDRRALTAAYQYLVMGTIGATFIVIAIGLLYQATGTLNMADIAKRLPEAGYTNRTVIAAFAFLVIGAALKIALFPLHQWLPNAYTYAPNIVSAFLAATATKVSVYILLRFIFSVFGVEFSFGTLPTALPLMILAGLAMFLPSIVACFQMNVKRVLAYSSVAQIGYMILGLTFVSVAGLTASILHLFNHALMKGALFLVLGAVFYRIGSCNIDRMAGLARQMPWTMAAFVGGGLSLVGIPLTAGFISKWYLILAALEKGWWYVAILIVISSLIAVIYVWRVIEAAYFREAPDDLKNVKEAPMSLLLPAWIMVIANFYFGIETSVSVGISEIAAQALMGGG
ncbi:MAG: monovalent cation/H+ antiporter subunit D family protein [Pseudomonadota bacterium]|nr:monovalent cation/H+ antiporter subunit D family protein [Pseudomonadota bacterium]